MILVWQKETVLSKVTETIRLRTSDLRLPTSAFLLKHQFFNLLLVLLFILKIEHSTKYMVP